MSSEAVGNKTNPLLRSALDCAEMYGPVLALWWTDADGRCACPNPECRRGGNDPDATPGKHPLGDLVPHGDKNATRDPRTIRQWWQRYPKAHVAVRVGPTFNTVVIDNDPRNGGNATWQALERLHGPAPETLRQTTGGGGWHGIYKRPSDGRQVHSPGPGIDIKGGGEKDQYIVVAPSGHYSSADARYEWINFGVPLAPFPEWPEFFKRKGAAPLGETIEQRHVELTSYAGTLRQRGLNEDEIFESLMVVNQSRSSPEPLSDDEVHRIARIAGSWKLDASDLTRYDRTDDGNAQRFIDMQGDVLRFVTVSKAKGWWLAWDSRRWSDNAWAEVQERARQTARFMRAEAITAMTSEMDPHKLKLAKDRLAWALQSASRMKIDSMVALARSDPRVRVLEPQLDADPWLLNTPSGTIDLRTGVQRAACKDDLITKCTLASLPAGAPDPIHTEQWDSFLRDCATRLDGTVDVAFIRYVKLAAGYSVTGSMREDKLFFAYGGGKSGKSSFVGAAKAALGDYSVTAAFETFIQNKFNSSSNNIADLRGARLISSIEVEHGRKLAESVVKEMTGGDPIRARRLYENNSEFLPQGKLWLVANNKPLVRGVDDANWRRIRVLPFEHKIPDQNIDRTLRDRLRDPDKFGPIVLQWMVEGCLEWQHLEKGLDDAEPKSVTDASALYREESADQIALWMDTWCDIDSGASEEFTVLFQSYRNFAAVSGFNRPLALNSFGSALTEHGYPDAGGRPKRRRGLRLHAST